MSFSDGDGQRWGQTSSSETAICYNSVGLSMCKARVCSRVGAHPVRGSGRAVDEKSKNKAITKFIETKLPKYRAWQSGTGAINMHPTHPLADMKPREQFLVALDRTTPEVKASLDELAPLYSQAYATLKQNYSGPNELEDWGEALYMARHVRHYNREYEQIFATLGSSLELWADRWSLGEGYWEANPAWVLNWAISYLKVAPQKNLAFTHMNDSSKEHLSKAERKLVIEENVWEYALNPWARDEYIRSTLKGWRRKLENHLDEMGQRLDAIHGGPVEKQSVEHFDWVVLRHVLGYSATTIVKAYEEIEQRMLRRGLEIPANFAPVRQSLDGKKGAFCKTSTLVGLKLRRSKRGSRQSGSVEAEIEDVIRRLQLDVFWKSQPAYE
jgi:hypothetical protein